MLIAACKLPFLLHALMSLLLSTRPSKIQAGTQQVEPTPSNKRSPIQASGLPEPPQPNTTLMTSNSSSPPKVPPAMSLPSPDPRPCLTMTTTPTSATCTTSSSHQELPTPQSPPPIANGFQPLLILRQLATNIDLFVI